MSSNLTRRVLSHPAYQSLTRQRRRLAWLLTAVMLAVYYGFILLVAFAPASLGQQLNGSVLTVGLPLGVGVILVAIGLTGLFVWKANGEYDRLTAELRRDVEA